MYLAEHYWKLLTSTRLELLRSSSNNKPYDSEFLTAYSAKCTEDLDVLSVFLPAMSDNARSSFNVAINSQNLGFSASVCEPIKNTFLIELSLGMFLAIDDFSGCIASSLMRKGSAHKPLIKMFTEEVKLSPRFYNYADFFENHNNLDTNFLDFLELPQGDFRQDYHSFCSNVMMLWIISHEIGHVALGHLGHFRKNKSDYAYSDIEFELFEEVLREDLSEHDLLEKRNRYYARELHADAFATMHLVSVLFTDAAFQLLNSFSFEHRASYYTLVISCITNPIFLFERTASFKGAHNHHPMALARAMNIWSMIDLSQENLLAPLSDLLSSIDESESLVTLTPATSEELIASMFSAIMNFDYLADHLGFHITENTGWKRTGWTFDLGEETPILTFNVQRATEINKLIQTIWAYRYGLNLFVPGEKSYSLMQQCIRSIGALSSELNDEYRPFRPFEDNGFAPFITEPLDQILEWFERESSEGLLETESLRKIFQNSIVISDQVAAFAKLPN